MTFEPFELGHETSVLAVLTESLVFVDVDFDLVVFDFVVSDSVVIDCVVADFVVLDFVVVDFVVTDLVVTGFVVVDVAFVLVVPPTRADAASTCTPSGLT